MSIIRRLLVRAVIVGILLIGGYIVYDTYLQPDPTSILRVRATNDARDAILDRDWDTALDSIEQASLSIDHQDWELLTWYAVLLEKIQQPAEDMIEQALTIGKPDDVWITYGMVAILADDSEMILRAGQALIDDNKDSVQGYFLIAQAYDLGDDLEEALRYYDMTIEKIGESEGYEGIYITVQQRVAQINIELLGEEVTCC